MGERSFGKGSVQTVVQTGPQAALRLTTARYYTPSGRSVQAGGIDPDITVPQLSDADYKDRPRVREADLRRHLLSQAKVEDKLLEDDDTPDPRFTATAGRAREEGRQGLPARLCAQDAEAAARPGRRRLGGIAKAVAKMNEAALAPRRGMLGLGNAAARRGCSRCCCPLALLGGALGSQYLGGLHPCEMCYWQRWPHGAAILLAAAAPSPPPAASPRSRTLTLLAALRDRRLRRDRRLSRGRRSWAVGGLHHLHRDRRD